MAQREMPERGQYPNNSDRAKMRQDRDEEITQKVNKVTKGKVTQKKKSFFKRMKESFGIKESQGVFDYIFFDIIIPATQNMVLDSIINGAEMAILGETRRGRSRRGYGDGRGYRYDRVSYRDDGRGYGRDRREEDREGRRLPSSIRDYEDILFDSQRDAEDVISGLVDMIDAYGQATVRDLYDLSGLSCDYTCGNFGWHNLSSARIKPGRDGYYLDLPRAVVL